jgi:hypothetical protein
MRVAIGALSIEIENPSRKQGILKVAVGIIKAD